ncbi:MAG: tetratricopeptide repeat protein [Elusimicrobia bacterium]|nr:tetratricopeptide repeat protein [Elusimicrobiota bacterium]
MFQQAAAHNQTVLTLASGILRTIGLKQLASIQIKQRRYQEAIPPLQEAIARDPQVLELHQLLGACHRALGNAQKAEEEFALESALRREQAPPWSR